VLELTSARCGECSAAVGGAHANDSIGAALMAALPSITVLIVGQPINSAQRVQLSAQRAAAVLAYLVQSRRGTADDTRGL
jgi:hypothetical protein